MAIENVIQAVQTNQIQSMLVEPVVEESIVVMLLKKQMQS
jgi:hypothetical protein